ncbi:hypothetical protein [Levilactobacillus enshiensis]|uniref:hypothetical protein n=1 Tax=Levilactobacillus enshiensis TaxID=2590213 RepID=UPI001179DDDB|nr:hypothetical protein [Levilactobacillus enshiensis]
MFKYVMSGVITSLLTVAFVYYLTISGPVRWGVLLGLLLMNNWAVYQVLAHWDAFLHGPISRYQELLFIIVAGIINLIYSDATHLTGGLFWLWLGGEILSSLAVAWLVTRVIVRSYHWLRRMLKMEIGDK